MKTFTIENETHHITIHNSAKEAAAVPNSERFGSEAQLAKLAAHWPAPIEIWNSLPGETPARKFQDRATAISQIWKAIQSFLNPFGNGNRFGSIFGNRRRFVDGSRWNPAQAAMGWHSHTTRAMMSAGGSLAKKHGLVISREKVGDQRTYSIKA
jgi:Protein of unknown function (DUF3489)